MAEGRSLDPDGEGPLYLVIVRLRLATARGRFDDARRRARGRQPDGRRRRRLRPGRLPPDRRRGARLLGGPTRPGGSGRRGRPGGPRGQRRRLPRDAAPGPGRPGGRRPGRDGPRLARRGGARPTAEAAAARTVARLDAPRRRRACRTGPSTRGLAASSALGAGRVRAGDAARTPRAWAGLAEAWHDLDVPAQAAYARWRRAEAILAGRGGRRAAAADLRAAAEAARLGAGPLGRGRRRPGPEGRDPPPGGRWRRRSGPARSCSPTSSGSTALIETIGDDAWTALRAWHDATLRRLFAAHGGVEVDHAGDGFFVTFPSPRSPASRAPSRSSARSRSIAGEPASPRGSGSASITARRFGPGRGGRAARSTSRRA